MPTLLPGNVAPLFSLPASTGKTVSLNELAGKKVILYFYPKDDTPGCTKEACGFRDLISEIKMAGAEVFGVSPDSVESHQAFIKKFALTFPLLADSKYPTIRAACVVYNGLRRYYEDSKSRLKLCVCAHSPRSLRTTKIHTYQELKIISMN